MQESSKIGSNKELAKCCRIDVCSLDIVSLERILQKDLSYIDSLSESGNAPLHIAAFKHDENVTHMLLQYGANPCIRNLSHGDTAAHISCKFGDLKNLKVLAETGLCDLYSTNGLGKNLFDISLDDNILEVANMFYFYSVWNNSCTCFDELATIVLNGRRKCLQYLLNLEEERKKSCKDFFVKSIVLDNHMLQNTRNILRGHGELHDRNYFFELDHPYVGTTKDPFVDMTTEMRNQMWKLADEELIEISTTKLFSEDYTVRLMRTAINNASK
jgi:hypothetical protein